MRVSGVVGSVVVGFCGLFFCGSVAAAELGASQQAVMAALEDGFYELAERRVREAGALEGDEGVEWSVLLAHALWGQGRFETLIEEVDAPERDGRLLYWVARAWEGLDDGLAALGVLELEPQVDAMGAERLRLRGRLLLDAGRLVEAEGVMLRFDAVFGEHSSAWENRFELALVVRAQGREEEALKQMLVVERERSGALGRRAQLVVAEWLGDQDVAGARARLMGLLDEPEVEMPLRLRAVDALVELEFAAGEMMEAAAVLERAVAWVGEPLERVKLRVKLADCYEDTGDVEGALAWIEEAQTEVTSREWALRLQLRRAELLTELGSFERAAKLFQSVLEVSDDRGQLARAYYGRGRCLGKLGRSEESGFLFERVLGLAKQDALLADAMFRGADAFYQAERFEKAEALYGRFLEAFPEHGERARGMYQLGLTLARIGRREAALEQFGALAVRFEGSSLAVDALLRSADVWMAEGMWSRALEIYERLEGEAADEEVVALSRLQRGLLLYELRRYEEAERVFRGLIEVEGPSALQAEYMRAFSLYMLGEVEQALALCRTYIEEHTDSVWTPEVMFWLGEQAFNSGAYGEAEEGFLRVYRLFGGHVLAEKALFQAGQAAMREQRFTVANTHFSELVRVYPESVLLAQTRFSQGDALTELGEHARAILAFEEVLKNFPQHALVFAAEGRVADCQFALGANQPERFEVALSGYRALLGRVGLDEVLRLQTLYKLGRSAEKMGRPDEAFDAYMKAVYGYLSDEGMSHPENEVWFTRAGFAAAAIQTRLENVSGALAVYERMVEADVSASEEARKRALALETIPVKDGLLKEAE